MSELIDSIERRQLRKELPRFREGDRLRVHFQVVEGTRRRTQVFEGVVMRLQGAGSRRTFTVRKLSFGIGVERTFPLHSPKVERIEVMARGEVRRAKLYYLRERIGRRARVRERRDVGPEELAEVMITPNGAETPESGEEAEPAAADAAAGQDGEPESEQPSEQQADAATEEPPGAATEEPSQEVEQAPEPEQSAEADQQTRSEEKD